MNPYTPGQLPRFLVGRDTELERIRRQLSRVEDLGDIGGPMLIFTAPRGVGKTSLLRAAVEDAQPRGFLTAWVSCVRGRPFLPELDAAISRSLTDLDTTSPPRRPRPGARWTSLSVEVGLPGAKATAEFDRPPAAAATATSAAVVSDLEDLLHRTATSVREAGGAGLAVFVDELHAAHVPDLAVLLNAFQNLGGRHDRPPLAIIAAGLPSTPGHVTRAATFGERSAFVALPRLDQAAAARALAAPAAELGVPWSDAAVQLVEASAVGYPYFLQLLGASTWDAARPDRGDTLTADHVRTGAGAASDQIHAMYEARWHAATDLERDVMAAMSQHPDDDVPRSVIATALGRDSRAISVPRDRLIDKGIIEPAGHGRLRLTLPGFAAYVRTQTDPPGTDHGAQPGLPAWQPIPPPGRRDRPTP